MDIFSRGRQSLVRRKKKYHRGLKERNRGNLAIGYRHVQNRDSGDARQKEEVGKTPFKGESKDLFLYLHQQLIGKDRKTI